MPGQGAGAVPKRNGANSTRETYRPSAGGRRVRRRTLTLNTLGTTMVRVGRRFRYPPALEERMTQPDPRAIFEIERPDPKVLTYYVLQCLLTGPLFFILIVPNYF